jgi:protein-S-isoprenylcysteine O-methyltransferase Ste14
MANEVHSATEPSVASLVTGITDDFQQLIRQQVTLVRQEIQEDLRKSKEGAIAFALGAGAAAVSVILIAFTVVYALAVTSLPMWACFAIVAAIFVVLAAVLIMAGKQKFDSIRPMENQAVQGLRENLEWQTNPH